MFLFFMVVVAAIIIGGILFSQHTDEAWRGAAAELGLKYKSSFLKGRAIEGLADGVPVEITVSGGRNSATCLSAYPRGLAPSLAVRAEGTWTNLGKMFIGEDVQLNDPGFDEAVNIHGNEAEIVALMDRDTRHDVMHLTALGGTIAGGEISLRRGGVLRDQAELVLYTRLLVRLGKRLTRGQTRDLLVANAQNDPQRDVRVRNLEMLAREFGETEEARQAAAHALKDPSPQVRLLAGRLVGGTVGFEVLRELVGDQKAPAATRASALEHLVAHHKFEDTKELVTSALASPDAELRRAAVVAVGQAKDASQVEIIAALSSDSDPALSAAAATTLGLLGDPQAEDALIRLLACENSAVRCAAAKSLGIVGTVRAVEPLLPLTKGLLGDAELRQAAQDAVRRIQGSLGDVDAGRVSVVKVEDVAGALSLTADGGELSLPPEKKREPSS